MSDKEKLKEIIERIDGAHFDLHYSRMPASDKSGLINSALDQISSALDYLEKAAEGMED